MKRKVVCHMAENKTRRDKENKIYEKQYGSK